MKDVVYDKNKQNVPVKFWLPKEEVEEGAMEQAINLSKLPFAYKHIAIMPDTHQGYGMPIGGVLATKDVVVPNAVGVDIGCGMCALKTIIIADDLSEDDLKKVMGKIRESVPVGFKHHDEPQDEGWMPSVTASELDTKYPVISRQYKSAMKQVGTLGGGNHFLEIQKDQDGYIWIMIHSGSRNLGKQVADHYHDMAKELNKKWYSQRVNEDLSFLPVDSKQGSNYIREMEYCVDFALSSRKLMMKKAKEAFVEVVELDPKEMGEDFINIAHNYADLENHFGKNVIVHRKGATLAREGTRGIIPGSQGAPSFIVKGKGNNESFHSCSHGAGRTMSRTQAKKELDMDEVKESMEGILHAVRNEGDLDEAPQAYKDINIVIERQGDLVEVLHKLEPLGVVKG